MLCKCMGVCVSVGYIHLRLSMNVTVLTCCDGFALLLLLAFGNWAVILQTYIYI